MRKIKSDPRACPGKFALCRRKRTQGDRHEIRRCSCSFAALLCWTGTANAETIKVGVVLPYSGPNADLGNQVDKAFDLYVKLHAKDLGDHKIELIKRDEGPASGANAQNRGHRAHHQRQSEAACRLRVLAGCDCRRAAGDPGENTDADRQRRNGVDHDFVALHRALLLQHVGSGLSDGHLRGDQIRLQDRRRRLHRLPSRSGFALAFKTAFEKAGGKVIDEIRMGPPGPVPDFTPLFQRVKDEHPDCFYVFVPSGSHAGGVMKTYGDLGMRQAGVRLIGPMDLIPDYELAHMSDAAIGLVVMSSYADDLDTPLNKEFVKAWHEAYGPNSYPDFMSAAGMDTMAAIFDVINTLNGNLDDGAKVIDTLKGWKHVGLRGPIEIDPQTRDVIQPERVEEVIKKPDGKLGVKVLETYPAGEGRVQGPEGRTLRFGFVSERRPDGTFGICAGGRGGILACGRRRRLRSKLVARGQHHRQYSVRWSGLGHVPVHHLRRAFGHDGADGRRQSGAWRVRHGRRLFGADGDRELGRSVLAVARHHLPGCRLPSASSSSARFIPSSTAPANSTRCC